jgi:hypothetical protein
MTVEVIRPREVAAPAVESLRGTLYDVAPPVENYSWVDPVDIFTTMNCLGSRATGVVCGTPGTKTFDTPTWVDGARFAGYAGVVCKGPGSGGSADAADVQAAFERIESRIAEQGLVEAVLSEQPASPTDRTPTPGTAINPQRGLAILEEYAAGLYAGVATLHIPRGIAQYLSQSGAIDTSGNVWHTNVGTKVSAGGGYALVNKGPNNAAATAGAFWMWVTGEVLILRSDVIAVNEMSRINNDNQVLVERAFIAAVDCLVGAVLVAVP